MRDLDALQALGFTELEALVYAELLRESPATGYRISHAIGRPTPNTYKAIAALARKGAVLVDDGASRLCRAVPPEEVLAGLDRRFQADKARALRSLRALGPLDGDDRVYRILSAPQVLERARAMLGRARTLVLLDAFPGPLAELGEALAGAAGRARVVAKVYGPSPAVAGLTLVPAVDAERVRAAWPGQQLSLVVDAEEHLLALFSADMSTVHQAVASHSTFLSCMQHNHLASELLHTALRAGTPALDPDSLSLTASGVAGHRALLARFGPREAGPAQPKPGRIKRPKKAPR